ncbi:MAG: DUF971 domain-containing protein [Acidobacteria bacterium]|nr:DUF971 domain-containing protein [Acidobacteriota bacterium]MBI3423661.1 DUF971 domain-containing protein [Acidobacteriota bacterium]
MTQPTAPEHSRISVFPAGLELTDSDTVLQINWDDGHVSRHRLDVLRAACPCAHCKGHAPEQSLKLESAQFPGVKLTDMAAVGRYAYHLVFSDHHDTGIYTLKMLYEIPNSA